MQKNKMKKKKIGNEPREKRTEEKLTKPGVVRSGSQSFKKKKEKEIREINVPGF